MKPQDRYKLDPKPLGIGGYATVWRATDKETGRVVALKRRKQRDRDGAVRLRREIEVLRQLKHEHIVRLLEASPLNDWYTMPVAEGTLDSLRKHIDEEELLRAIEHAAIGLAFAHEHDFVHRDVTPRNILGFRDDGGRLHWVIADWGLVRRPQGQTSRPLTQGGLGTAPFLAPEAWNDGHAVDARADIYSLGRVAAWAATGQPLVPNMPLVPEGPTKVFVQRTTELDRTRRPQSMLEALELLRRPESGAPALQVLLWQQEALAGAQGGARGEAVTTWFQVDGTDVRRVGSRRGQLFSDGEQLWQWRTAERTILFPVREEYAELKPRWQQRLGRWRESLKGMLLPAQEPPHEPAPPRWREDTLEDAFLDNILRGESRQVSPLHPQRHAEEYLYELSRTTRVIGSVGRFLFILQSEYSDTGGAHGHFACDFYVLDANSGERVEELSAPMVEPLFEAEQKAAIAYFRGREELADPELTSPEGAELTLYKPVYDEAGRMRVELQFTVSVPYALSDHKWSSYTQSFNVVSPTLPELLQKAVSIPEALQRQLASIGRTNNLGWSLVGTSPAARAWLGEMLEK